MIKEYRKKDGSKAYMFKVYLGKDVITGKERHTTRRGFKTKREARLELARLQTQASENKLLYNQNMTVDELYDVWFESYVRTVKVSTLKTVKNIFKLHILPEFKNLKITQISPAFCQKIVNKWVDEYSVYRQYTLYAKRIFEYAVKLNIIHTNPFKHVQIPKNHNNTNIEYYTKDELKVILYQLKDYDLMLYTIVRVLSFTGCRIGELLALTWEDIDTFNMKININKTTTETSNGVVVQTPKTRSSNRIISIDRETSKILNTWKNFQRVEWLKYGFNASDSTQLVFSSTIHNNHLLNCGIRFRYVTFCKKYDIKCIKLHGFRHTHASLLLASGASIKEVQDRLGHSDIRTTMNIYTHVTQESRDRAADTFAKYINL